MLLIVVSLLVTETATGHEGWQPNHFFDFHRTDAPQTTEPENSGQSPVSGHEPKYQTPEPQLQYVEVVTGQQEKPEVQTEGYNSEHHGPYHQVHEHEMKLSLATKKFFKSPPYSSPDGIIQVASPRFQRIPASNFQPPDLPTDDLQSSDSMPHPVYTPPIPTTNYKFSSPDNSPSKLTPKLLVSALSKALENAQDSELDGWVQMLQSAFGNCANVNKIKRNDVAESESVGQLVRSLPRRVKDEGERMLDVESVNRATEMQSIGEKKKPAKKKRKRKFVCKADGFFADMANDCQHYFHCFNGVVYHFECPPGTRFDEVGSHCDWPEFVNCGINF